MSDTKYKKPSRTLRVRFNAHDQWVRTDGREGRQLTSTGDFSGLDLKGVNFERANLSTADFYRANLCRANLIAADLSGARLVETDLRNANMQKANLVLASLRGADIKGALFDKARTELTVWPKTISHEIKTVLKMNLNSRKQGFEPPV